MEILEDSKSEQRINCQCGGHYQNTASDKQQHQITKMHQQYIEEKHKLELIREGLKQYIGWTVKITYYLNNGRKTNLTGDVFRVNTNKVSLSRPRGNYRIELKNIEDFVEAKY